MRWIVFLVGLVAAVPAAAQPKLLQAHAAVSSYTGPIDVVASPTAWYGLRAGSAAIAATGTQKSVNVRRASDNATQDILILTSGDFDVASYNTFVGTDATASCTIAGTAAACTGATATLHVGDLITGVGVTDPCIVTVTNGSTTATVVVAGKGTTCGTVSVAETVTFQVAGLLPTWYDQTGSARNSTQPTAGTQPQLLPICLNSKPCVFFAGANYLTIAAGTQISQPNTLTTVAQRTALFTNFQIAEMNATEVEFNNGANLWSLFAGSRFTASATDSAWHVGIGVANGASSVLNIDGIDTAGNAGAGQMGQGASSGAQIAGTFPVTGYITENGVWAGTGFTSGNRTNVCHNTFLYWATSTSC